jgi:hypothetical protein
LYAAIQSPAIARRAAFELLQQVVHLAGAHQVVQLVSSLSLTCAFQFPL